MLAVLAVGCTAPTTTADRNVDPGAQASDVGAFDPSTLQPDSDRPLYYMTRSGFEDHVDDLDGLCRWVDELAAEAAGQHRPVRAVHEALVDAGVQAGDGLAAVVADYCGHGLSSTATDDGV